MYSIKENRNRRDAYKLHEPQDYVGGHSRNEHLEERYDERRRHEDYQSSRPTRQDFRDTREKEIFLDDRDYKGKWAAQKPRFEHSRSRSPYRDFASRSETGMAGLIFMCNKKTQRRCLAYHVLGMPMAKKRLADQVTPGMKLFLFEFESRELYGVFEAVSHAGMDLEPEAFVEAGIDFPVQVRFRVVESCPPLRESEFKDAILDNYFAANRFKFDLTKDQVSKLLRLFLPAEASQRSTEIRNPHYGFLPGANTFENVQSAGADFRGLPGNRVYRTDEYRRDEHWKKEIDPVPRPTYIDGSNRSEYPAHKESAGNAGYMPDYKHSRYYDGPNTAKLSSSRLETDTTWYSRGGDYDYNTVLDPLPSVSTSVHQIAPPTTAYGPLPSKYDSVVSGYHVGRPEMTGLPPEVDRYWKADESLLQMPAERQTVKSSMCNRQGLALYSDAGSGQRPASLDPIEDSSFRLPGKKAMLLDMEYLPHSAVSAPVMNGLAPVPVQGGGKEVDYRDVGPPYPSDLRKVPYGFADDSIDAPAKHSGRYSLPNGMAPGGGYPPTGMNIPDTTKDRYRREFSPRPPILPDGGYITAGRSYPHTPERDTNFERMKVDGNRHYEVQQPPPKPYYRRSSERYGFHSAEKNTHMGVHRKPSVWERVSGLGGPHQRGPRTNGNYNNNNYLKRRKDLPQAILDDTATYGNTEPDNEEESFVVDFKRRSKNGEHAGSSHHGDNGPPRKKRIVRPDATYPGGHGPGG